MPIHCCAMQGRMDAIQALLFFDTEESIKRNLEMESEVLKNDNYLAFFFLRIAMSTAPNTSCAYHVTQSERLINNLKECTPPAWERFHSSDWLKKWHRKSQPITKCLAYQSSMSFLLPESIKNKNETLCKPGCTSILDSNANRCPLCILQRTPPSLLHLSVANDFLDCAKWYVY